jgi:hypothetical protein
MSDITSVCTTISSHHLGIVDFLLFSFIFTNYTLWNSRVFTHYVFLLVNKHLSEKCLDSFGVGWCELDDGCSFFESMKTCACREELIIATIVEGNEGEFEHHYMMNLTMTHAGLLLEVKRPKS